MAKIIINITHKKEKAARGLSAVDLSCAVTAELEEHEEQMTLLMTQLLGAGLPDLIESANDQLVMLLEDQGVRVAEATVTPLGADATASDDAEETR
ncbi:MULTISPECIES: hypothetical protein [Lonsdalea]|uniref:Uncharacterized protein n=2 Tax=Lonsdalea TaxID=1082702 RepID=A0ACD1J8Y1_9GAMM|nr:MULTISPECIES: hypothetical protein [Lonsdalea]OSM95594.1 hypothetical protein AU508_10920 [Lonsdalea populi]OSM96675.1 hypothetical protein AU499_14135 [Lonsdalea populi]QPQ23393.1 hypothetical protein I6N93_12170 [Lonsdalea populi]RAT11409.1 hypothetical protein AU485_14470 [Lonsdalea quercina]RAT12844.1 hypothetical protein AU486_15440 [Lonsdalea quercina]